VRRINWITGGHLSTNWAYSTNAKRLITRLYNYSHDIDLNVDVCDIVVFFDILLMQKNLIHFPKAKKILRLSGERPFDVLKKKKIDYKKIADKADAIISVNSSLASLFDKKSNIYIIPNSVNLKLFNSDGYVPPKEFTIGFAGNISTDAQKEWKGYNLVLETTKQLNLPLITALRGNLEFKHQNMKKEFYNKISCLILPSISEGCSNTISEALACGIPVITCLNRCYHSQEMTQGRNIVYCDRTVFNISNCVRFLQDPKVWKNISESGQEFVRKNQDINIISKQWEEAIKKL
jgi:glycosyltransferase involved in cell wall biosynthesis